jgi:sigma-B regulation protein RsbU (phosphoserine phosphatase)
MKDYPYDSAGIILEQGDLLVAFTDGISETMNEADEEWGEANLTETVRGCHGASASETIDRIMSAADAFAAGAQQHDDMTLVVLRVC